MDIKTFIQARGGKATLDCHVLAKIARNAGCSAGTLYQIALGRRKPSGRLAGRISAETRGVVGMHELRPDFFPRPKRKKRAA